MRRIAVLPLLLLVLAPVPPARAEQPADAFMAALQALCGKAFAGRETVDTPPTGTFTGRAIVMHVRDCRDGEVRIPLHVGEDRLRTWVVTRTATGLRLKHDHRHADGSADEITQYGGDTADAGTAVRQSFPADGFSRDLFLRTGRAVSVDNVWALEVDPGRLFAYELQRPNRLVRLEFDLTAPVPAPPPPWGAE